MIRHFFRLLLGTGVLFVLSQAQAQDAVRPGEDYRQYFKKPQTVPEYWSAFQFEMEIGKYDLAALHLRGLLVKKPTEAELVAIEEKEGMHAFLKLRLVPRWSEVPAVQKQAVADVEDLIKQTTEAVRRHLSDPVRINKYVQNLTKSREEREFALRELYRSGALVVPYLLNELRTLQGGDRLPILYAMRRLSQEIVPPLLAALDSGDTQLIQEVIDVLVERKATEAIPYLWYLTSSAYPPEVRRKASDALAKFYNVAVSRLTPAKQALTQEAEKYYQHQVAFADPKAVSLWRWDKGSVTLTMVSASKAEEYYALRFAGQALAIDPAYEPAQVVWLSQILDKTYEEKGLAQPLAKSAPRVHDLLATSSPELLNVILERALADKRVPVILGMMRTLGSLAEVRATRPTARGQASLVRALNHPDRRVQFAAADALLNIPEAALSQQTTRIVEILRRILTVEPTAGGKSRVLVAYFAPDLAARVSDAVKLAGAEPIRVNTGRELLKRMNEAADIDLILMDEELPDPGFAFLLAQLRADHNYGQIPIVVTVGEKIEDIQRRQETLNRLRLSGRGPRENEKEALARIEETLRRQDMAKREDKLKRYLAQEKFKNVKMVPAGFALDPADLRVVFSQRVGEANNAPLAEAELKEYTEKAIQYLARMARGDIPGFDVRAAQEAVVGVLRSGRLTPEGQLAAVEVLGRLQGTRAQTELAAVVLGEKYPLRVRLLASTELIRHIQRHSPTMPRAVITQLETLQGQPDVEPALKANLSLLVGSLHPDPRTAGERMLRFPPNIPPANPLPPIPDKKD